MDWNLKLLGLGFGITFCSFGCASKTVTVTPTSAEVFHIVPAELAALEATAEKADSPVQARRIADYYTFVEFNEKKAAKWFRVAAKKGDGSAKATVENLYSRP